MSGSKIRHVGVVETISNDRMGVRIVQSSGCSGCKVAAHCTASDQREKLIDIYDQRSITGHRVGDEVVVVSTLSTGMRAVTLGFVIPFLILIIVLFAALYLTSSEGMSALLSIGALVPYYLLLYGFRDRMRAQFSFVIER